MVFDLSPQLAEQEAKAFRNNLNALLDRVGEYTEFMEKDEKVQHATAENVEVLDNARTKLIGLMSRFVAIGDKYREQLGM